MKIWNFLLSIALLAVTHSAKSQDTCVEKLTVGLQTGFFGAWAHAESRLSKKFTLRCELGYDVGLWAGYIYEKTGFVMAPSISIEPRFYYNLNKRASRLKRIDGNSANFLLIRTYYQPNLMVISNYKNMEVISFVAVSPAWGIRRNIGKRFNFELGIGVLTRFALGKNSNSEFLNNSRFQVGPNYHLRIGFKFF